MTLKPSTRHTLFSNSAHLALSAGVALTVLLILRGAGRADDAKPDPQVEQAIRRQSVNHLKQLGLAMHNYHSVNSRFPASAVFDKSGKPLLSWRVLILPYLEEKKLYDEFHLDEPWDSEHNKKLLERMPAVYRVDRTALKPGETPYVAFTGKGTLFEGTKGINMRDITDGTSNTLMFVESARPVPWTKPEDLPYDEGKPLPKLGILPSGFDGGLCDGSVRWFKASLPEKELRALITRNGREPIDPSKF
jgi:hypothetical protein